MTVSPPHSSPHTPPCQSPPYKLFFLSYRQFLQSVFYFQSLISLSPSPPFQSILEVFLLCLAGYILAGRGILDKKTQKVHSLISFSSVDAHLFHTQQLNRLNVSLFTPSLLFSKVAFFLSPGFVSACPSIYRYLTCDSQPSYANYG